jgi:hypothetical protein
MTLVVEFQQKELFLYQAAQLNAKILPTLLNAAPMKRR